ncbi:MAG: DUF2933 domain-containing protein [Acidimicrobiia bacterium]
MCLNKRVLIGLGVAALAVFAVAPRLLGAVAPLLVLAACPLSMVFMMRAMTRGQRPSDGGGADGGAEGTAAPMSLDRDAELRELHEEVNRLKAEVRLRSQEPTA